MIITLRRDNNNIICNIILQNFAVGIITISTALSRIKWKGEQTYCECKRLIRLIYDI